MSFKDDIEEMYKTLDNINKALGVARSATRYAADQADKILKKKPRLTLVKNEESSLHQDGE